VDPLKPVPSQGTRAPGLFLEGKEGVAANSAGAAALDRITRIYETILGTTDDFAYIFDPEGRFLYANAPLLKVWARTLDQVIGKTCYDLGYPTWHADMHMREIREIVRNKTPIRGEVPFTGDSGISGVYDYIFKPVLDASGHVELIVGTTRDVTDRKRDEEKLKATRLELQQRAEQLETALKDKIGSEQRYRFLADSVPQIVWTARPDGNLDYYNQRWFDYSGSSLEEMEKVGWTSFVHPEDLPPAIAAWQTSIATGHSYEVSFRIRRASDGAYRWHLVRAFPMKAADGRIVQWVGTCTDTDDQLRATELLEKTVAERTAKLETLVEELDSFSYSISHDLRAPLRAMMGFAQALEEDHAAHLDEEGKHYLERISSASLRMDELIKAVLSYSRINRDELKLQPINPRVLIAEILGTYPHLSPTQITVDLPAEFPLILANESALIQCISNLLSNAVKFVRSGTRPHVKIWAESRNGQVLLWFKDNGIGIARENLETIFEMFKRVDHDHEGTGIGLAIVKKAVERMGGHVGVESELGQGSSFWLEFRAA
jgi:PAS domain S-box-containing protein